jgi:hypothetical protein
MMNLPVGKRALVGSVAAVVVAAGVVSISSQTGAAAPAAKRVDRQQIARLLLEHGRGRFATASKLRALQAMAGELPGGPDGLVPERGPAAAVAAGATAAPPPRAGVANVRVNNPAADQPQTDQTTQSETTMAVVGQKVAVGFNDSQRSLLALTNGSDLSGYAYSTDGGKTFTDGGVLPNLPNFANLGDPWMAKDRGGRMYYSTLALGGNVFNLEVGVARSDNGGKTWSTPTLASPNSDTLFYGGDKEAITTGRDPKVAALDNVYAAWDDFAFDTSNGEGFQGLPVARSTDRGRHWALSYADKIVSDLNSCSFSQYIGAQPLVDPANGRLYVAAEKIAVDDPECIGGTVAFSQMIFTSTDGGRTFGPGRTISPVTSATPGGALDLGSGQLIRTIEFPVLTLHGGNLWAAWNDGRTGRSHILLAKSSNGGATWSVSAATSGTTDEIQPALTSDGEGLHLAYYQRNGNDTLDLVAADSGDGIHFTARRITSRSFPGVVTMPQFDPIIAFGYMGDYVSVVSDGTTQYFAWGDNRDRVTNFLHPAGRNDPDVFFARR